MQFEFQEGRSVKVTNKMYHHTARHHLKSAQSHATDEMVSDAGRNAGHDTDPMKKLRNLCLARGPTGILQLGRVLRRLDQDGSGRLDLQEFSQGIQAEGIGLSSDELETIFKRFNTDHTRKINMDEFIVALRPEMSDSRKKSIEAAFQKLDKVQQGLITLDDLRNVYSVLEHPQYKTGEADKDEILDKFLANFKEGNIDGKVSHEEFMNYYSGVSATVDTDSYFDLMIRQAYKLQISEDDQARSHKMHHHTARHHHKSAQDQATDEMVTEAGRNAGLDTDPMKKLRNLCLARGPTGILQLGRVLRRLDQDGSGRLDLQEFSQGIQAEGIGLNMDELEAIFKRFDTDDTGKINMDEFIVAVRPEMSDSRKKSIEAAFQKLDKVQLGLITLDDLRRVYNVLGHPLYKTGEADKDEILDKFLANFKEGNIDGKVSHEEFMNYYSGVSATVDTDSYFDLMIRQAYKL